MFGKFDKAMQRKINCVLLFLVFSFIFFICILLFDTDAEEVTKREGEECGPCFSPNNNYFCGTCVAGLDCTKDPRSNQLPNLPSRCKTKTG